MKFGRKMLIDMSDRRKSQKREMNRKGTHRNQAARHTARQWKQQAARSLAAGLALSLALGIVVPGIGLSNASEVSAAPAEAQGGNQQSGNQQGGNQQSETAKSETAQRSKVVLAADNLPALAAERDIMALLYLCEEYGLKEEPSASAEVVATLSSGQTVFIKDATYDSGKQILWLQVSCESAAGTVTGYVERDYLACSDERFLAWEENEARKQGMDSFSDRDVFTITDTNVTLDIEQFPESYQQGLMELKKAHPNWVFVPMNTGLDWYTVITEELKGGKSYVYKSLPVCTREGDTGQTGWYYASREILEYYMDPRNAMTDSRIFQFELLTYNETYHTEEAVESFLKNTFMKGDKNAPGTTMKFSKIFWAIGAEEGREVSPFHLAARVYQEQGQGTSPLISGTYPGYERYYNYFNVKATGKTSEEVIINGLKYAKEQDWRDAYFSILGGSDLLAAKYIKKGQDTLYLQKYNVNPNSPDLYNHQYMQNISAPTSEASSIKKLYASADAVDNSFVFKIPVFDNMPESACPYPTSSTNVVLQVPAGYDGTIWVGGIPYTPESRNNRQIVKTVDDKATDAVVYSYSSDGVPTGMYVWTLSYADGCYAATPQPDLKDLLSYHGFSIRISGDPGIRLKTGISQSLKSKLVSAGINGYKLKEYGTLVSDQADLTQYPVVRGKSYVISGVAYGKDSQGQPIDMVFETVDGRVRFTSVLTGLPMSSYQTDFSFRGYVVLEKDGKETVVYGPVRTRSMVSLANQVLDGGVYDADSEEAKFLRKLLEDAK